MSSSHSEAEASLPNSNTSNMPETLEIPDGPPGDIITPNYVTSSDSDDASDVQHVTLRRRRGLRERKPPNRYSP